MHSQKDYSSRIRSSRTEKKNSCSTTTCEFVLPNELPSVEEALEDLAAAMNALKTPELNKTEIMRLRTLIQTSSLYQKRFAEYVNYRKTEQRLIAAGDLACNARLNRIMIYQVVGRGS